MSQPSMIRPIRVAHFVTGGFSGGATQVALALVRAQMEDPAFAPLLILRKKRRTPKARLVQLREQGIPFVVVNGWTKVSTIAALYRVLRKQQVDVLLAHGFSEHLWGRYAGLLARTPVLMHVEHNTKERYTRWRLAQSKWLAQRTAALIGCSEGVRQVLAQQGIPAQKLHAISNGIYTQPFADAGAPWQMRKDGIVMVARFSKQKDHATLVRAAALLKAQGLTLPIYFAGGGKSLHRKPVEQLVASLGLQQQVHFLGVHKNVPELLKEYKFAVLSTHYEGMPLALIEGMAAGCLALASRAPGAQEVIDDGETGYLVGHADAEDLATRLKQALAQPEQSQRIADAGRAKALQQYSYAAMSQGYADLIQAQYALAQKANS